MSASAIRRKSYKKAQEDSGPFCPVHWDEGSCSSGTEVPAGKLQVIEKFFTPVQQAKDAKGIPGLARKGCRGHQPWAESRSDRCSILSSSSAASATSSSASWSSEASLDKEAFLPARPRCHPRHAQSCVDISGTAARAFRQAHGAGAADEGEGPAGSFARLTRGQSKSADRLPPQLDAHSLPGHTEGINRHLYRAISLERSLLASEQAESRTPRQTHRTNAPAPGKGILKNGLAVGSEKLLKAKSVETIPVRSTAREPQTASGPVRPLGQKRQPPNSLELRAPPKPPVTERMKLTEQKLRFSEFLDQITRQVMSPSSLSSLGWKPPEAAAAASKPPSTDESESKGSGSKASSPGSLLEAAEGKTKEAKASHSRTRRRQPEAKGDAALSRHNRFKTDSGPARMSDEAGASLELGSLPKLSADPSKGPKKPREAGAGKEAEGHGPLPEKPDQDAAGIAEKLNGKGRQECAVRKTRIYSKELLAEMTAEQPMSSQEKGKSSPDQKGEVEPEAGPDQQGLQKTWEELEALKEKFNRLQEDYSNTRQTNRLLEEKLQTIAQDMAEERQALNRRLNELLERLVCAQDTICSLEKMNISEPLSKSGTKRRCGEKAESPNSLCSLQTLDVAPPPAFMDGAFDAQTTSSRSDSAPEASKPSCSAESDTATPDGTRGRPREYEALVAATEGPVKHTRATAFTPWKQTSTTFSTDHASSTESEGSREETTPLCPLSTSRFLYLRPEALAAPSEQSGFPPLPTPESAVFEVAHPTSPSGQPGLVAGEPSTSDSSTGEEISWDPGLVEKTSASPLDYQSAQNMLDSLLCKSSQHGRSREKERGTVTPPGLYHFAGGQEGSRRGRIASRQHRMRYFQEFSSPEESPEGKSYACAPHALGHLLRGTKGTTLGRDSAHDSTSL